MAKANIYFWMSKHTRKRKRDIELRLGNWELFPASFIKFGNVKCIERKAQ